MRYLVFNCCGLCAVIRYFDQIPLYPYPQSFFFKTLLVQIMLRLLINVVALGILVSIVWTFVTNLSYTVFLTQILSYASLTLLKSAGKVLHLLTSVHLPSVFKLTKYVFDASNSLQNNFPCLIR